MDVPRDLNERRTMNFDSIPVAVKTYPKDDSDRCKQAWVVLGKAFFALVLLAAAVSPFFIILFQRMSEMQAVIDRLRSLGATASNKTSLDRAWEGRIRELKEDIEANQKAIKTSARDVELQNSTLAQHMVHSSASSASTANVLDQHAQAIDANADSIKNVKSAMAGVNKNLTDLLAQHMVHSSASSASTANVLDQHAQAIDDNADSIKNVETAMAGVNKNLTDVLALLSAKRAAGECKNPLPGADEIGRWIDPKSLSRGRSAIKQLCRDGRRYKNPFGITITYDVSDSIDTVTHHAETDATASVQAFSNLDEWKRAEISSSGWDISILGFLSLGSSKETQKMNGYFTNQASRLYEVRRRFGSVEAILKGDLEPYLTTEVKDALRALPRNYSEETKQPFLDFFKRYGPFMIDQVYSGGMIKATVMLSEGATVEAENTASATYSGVQASVGEWALGFGTGGGGGTSTLSAAIRSQSSSEIQVMGGDHTDPLAFDVTAWTSDDYERWMQSVRQSPKMINYRVRSAAELTNDPALKAALRDAISDVYGNTLDDAEKYQELIHNYHAVVDRVDGISIPSGRHAITYDSCVWITPITNAQNCGGWGKTACCPENGVVRNFHSQHHSGELHWFVKIECCSGPHVLL